MRLVMVVVLLLSAACKKDHLAGAGATPAAAPPPAAAPLDVMGKLWARAPAGTIGGVAISPRGLSMIESSASTIQVMLAAPELAEAKRMLDEELRKVLGTVTLSRAELGLETDRGLAVFRLMSGTIAFLPVADPDRLRQWVAGLSAHHTDPGDEPITCRPSGDLYACTSNAELFGSVGKGSRPPPVAELGARGDIEFFGDLPPMPIIQVAGVAQLERGTVTLRGLLKPDTGRSAGKLQMFAGPPARPRIDRDRAAGFFVAYLGGFAAEMARNLLRDRSLEDAARTLDGPLTVAVPSGDTGFDAQQSLSEPGPMRGLIQRCPKLLGWLDNGATVQGDACRFWLLSAPVDASVVGRSYRSRARARRGRASR